MLTKTEGHNLLRKDYAHSPLRGFESYLRVVIDLNEDNIQLIKKQYNSKVISNKASPGAYTFKNLTEVLSMGVFKNMKS